MCASLWLATAAAHAQAPAWQTVQAVAPTTASVGSNDYSAVVATAPDGAGNLYVAGSFMGTVTLGSVTLTSTGANGSGFVAKWLAATGTYAWVVPADADIRGLTAQSGAVYLPGYTSGPTATFGSTVLSSDGFVAKLTDAGTSASWSWALPVDDLAKGVAVSGTNVYIVGSYSRAAHFGSTTLPYADPSGYPDVYVAKITDAGSTASFAWAYSTGTVGAEDLGNAVVATGSTVYVTGLVSAAAPVFGSSASTAAGLFVSRLNDAGSTASVGWVSTVANSAPNVGANSRRLALGAGRVYIIGSFSGPVSFGSTTLQAPANGLGFVARLDDTGTAGHFAWATPAAATLRDMTVSGTSVYVAGYFEAATATFGSTTLANADPSGSSADAVVAKLNDAGTSGTFAWAKSAGSSPGGDGVNALALNGSTLFVGGATENPTVSFAPLTLANPTGNSIGFLATLNDPTLTATLAPRPTSLAYCFPNPAHGTVHVGGANGLPLNLFDTLGRIVRHYPAPTGPEAVLDVHGLPTGVYVLQYGSRSQRLVVE